MTTINRNAMPLRKIIPLLVLLSAGPLTAGCSLVHAQSRIDPRTVVSYGTPGCFVSKYMRGTGGSDNAVGERAEANAGVVNLDCARFPGTKPDGATAYQLAAGSEPGVDAEQQRQYRNRLGNILIKHSDDSCIASLGRAANNEAFTNAGLASLTTALSATATIVTGELAKSILTGLATTTSGARDHINAEVFRNKVVSAVTRAINNERAKLLGGIEESMKLPVAAYDVDAMIRQINFRHQACSFIRGLELVSNAVDRAPAADRTLLIEGLDRAIAGLQTNRAMVQDAEKQKEIDATIAKLLIQRAQVSAAANPNTPSEGTPAKPDE